MRVQLLVTMDYEHGTEDQVRRLVEDIINNTIDTGEYKGYSDVEWPALVGSVELTKSAKVV